MDASEALVSDVLARCGGNAKAAYVFLYELWKAAKTGEQYARAREAMDLVWSRMSPADRVGSSVVAQEHRQDQARAAALLGA